MTAVAGLMRTALAALLLVAAAAKALDLAGMAAIVGSYRVLPTDLALPAAAAVAMAEAVVGCLLLMARMRTLGCVASAAMHGVYLAWSATALVRGLEIANCGCFGVFWPRPLSAVTLVEDVVLIVVSLVLARHYRRMATQP